MDLKQKSRIVLLVFALSLSALIGANHYEIIQIGILNNLLSQVIISAFVVIYFLILLIRRVYKKDIWQFIAVAIMLGGVQILWEESMMSIAFTLLDIILIFYILNYAYKHFSSEKEKNEASSE